VDDTTLSEVLQPNSSNSNINDFMENLLNWADQNHMQLNTAKTKEMILGPLSRSHLPILSTPLGPIDRVSSFKLLGAYMETTLCWSLHVDNMIQKATKRLYYLKQLKRAGLPSNHLFHYYSTVIRPVLEYCVPAWHYALTKGQTEQLEAIQKRAIHIILNFSSGMPYILMLSAANLTTLSSRRQEISKTIFSPYYQTNFMLAPPPPRTKRTLSH